MAAAGARRPQFCSVCSRRRARPSSWDIYLKGFYAAPFGRTDPAFGNNLGFYVFSLPLLEDWRDLFMLILFLTRGGDRE